MNTAKYAHCIDHIRDYLWDNDIPYRVNEQWELCIKITLSKYASNNSK